MFERYFPVEQVRQLMAEKSQVSQLASQGAHVVEVFPYVPGAQLPHVVVP